MSDRRRMWSTRRRTISVGAVAIGSLCVGCPAPKAPEILVTKKVGEMVRHEVCSFYDQVHQNLKPTDTVAFMTSVVYTKQGTVALGSSTIFIVGTAQVTQAATTQITGTYTAPTLALMCPTQTTKEVFDPEYQVLDTSTMELKPR